LRFGRRRSRRHDDRSEQGVGHTGLRRTSSQDHRNNLFAQPTDRVGTSEGLPSNPGGVASLFDANTTIQIMGHWLRFRDDREAHVAFEDWGLHIQAAAYRRTAKR